VKYWLDSGVSMPPDLAAARQDGDVLEHGAAPVAESAGRTALVLCDDGVG
jgi:hypothetical protein